LTDAVIPAVADVGYILVGQQALVSFPLRRSVIASVPFGSTSTLRNSFAKALADCQPGTWESG
jgi:hypothetical protein